MKEDLVYPEPEPQMYDGRLLKKGIKWETEAHIKWMVMKEHYDRFNSVPKQIREEVLETFKKGGITIGEVAEKFKIDSAIVGDIVYLNITEVSILNPRSL